MYFHILRASGSGLRDLFLLVLLLLVAGCVEVHAREGEAPRIEVFMAGDAPHLEKTAGVTVYRIDAIDRLQAVLSRELPGDPQTARDIVLARFARLDADQGLRLENAARGLARAMRYGIDRYPAIIFDGQAVVYGVPDIDVARQLWRAWQKAQVGH